MSEIVIEKVTVNVGETIPTGNFRSFRYDVQLTASVPPESDHNEVHDYLQREAELLVNEKKNDLMRAMGAVQDEDIPSQVPEGW